MIFCRVVYDIIACLLNQRQFGVIGTLVTGGMYIPGTCEEFFGHVMATQRHDVPPRKRLEMVNATLRVTCDHSP